MANEKRLIDANAIPWEECYVPDGDIPWEYKKELCVCKSAIEQMPTVDAVEVVRCKDCKHRGSNLCPMETVELYPWFGTKNDAFCSYGERKDNGRSTSAV